MSGDLRGRRRFLRDSAALAGVALGGLRLAEAQMAGSGKGAAHLKDLHAYGERSRFETSIRIGNLGRYAKNPKPDEPHYTGPRTPLQDSIGILTPASLHYVVSHSYEPPDIDPSKHRIIIHGMVDRPLSLSMEDLKRLPFVTRIHFVECRANGNPSVQERTMPAATVQLTHGLTSCSEWTGVPLSLLLKQVGVQKGAAWLIAEGSEAGPHLKSIPIEKAMADVLVAYGQNGEAVRPEQGYPVRLIVPGYEGINNVKWLRRIKLVDKPYFGRAESTQYPELRPDGKARWFNSEMGPNSVITYPSGRQHLAGPGFYEIKGLAWSGSGVIKKVEVSIDAGKTWKEAQLQEPVHNKAHTRFRLGWNWDGKEAVLRSRCTDERGDVQPSMSELTKLWSLPSDYFDSPPYMFGHFNALQSWKVKTDGSVENALHS